MRYFCWIVLWGFLIAQRAWATPFVLPTAEADVTFTSDVSFSYPTYPNIEAGGDYNGDGWDDIAICQGGDVEIIFGKPFSKAEEITKQIDVRLLHVVAVSRIAKMKGADIDGDGMDELILFGIGSTGSYFDIVRIYYGRKIWSSTIDVDGVDLSLVGTAYSFPLFGSSIGTGDMDGDGIQDLLVGNGGASPKGRTNAGEVYLLRGKKQRRTGTYNLSTSTEVLTFQGGVSENGYGIGVGLGRAVGVSDTNHDGLSDLVLSAPYAGPEMGGKIFIIHGSTVFPAAPYDWDLASSSVSSEIRGEGLSGSGPNIESIDAGDMDGDGKEELVFFWDGLKPGIINGVDLGNSLIDLKSPSVNFHPWTVMPSPVYPPVFSDFNGDGKQDLFWRGNPSDAAVAITELSVFLSSDFSGFPLSSISTGSFKVTVLYGASAGVYSVGDVNHDGFSDLVMVEQPHATPYSFLGYVRVIYGFRPLTHPQAVFRTGTAESTSVLMDLKVDGDPTEVKFSGDVAEGWGDRWVPFQSVLPVRLSSGQGSRKVRVTFRNKFLRESQWVEGTVTLTSNQPQSKPLTNILRAEDGANGRVTVECQVTESAHIKAGVYDRRGQRLVDILDDERGVGVWPVEWDGKNASGKRVAPGIYFIQVETNGRVERHRIVVRG